MNSGMEAKYDVLGDIDSCPSVKMGPNLGIDKPRYPLHLDPNFDLETLTQDMSDRIIRIVEHLVARVQLPPSSFTSTSVPSQLYLSTGVHDLYATLLHRRAVASLPPPAANPNPIEPKKRKNHKPKQKTKSKTNFRNGPLTKTKNKRNRQTNKQTNNTKKPPIRQLRLLPLLLLPLVLLLLPPLLPPLLLLLLPLLLPLLLLPLLLPLPL